MDLDIQIEEELNNNKEYYDNIIAKIKSNFNGRSCNFRVILLSAIQKIFNLNTYLEIGVHNGTSLSCVVSVGKEKKCYGIDLFESTTKNYLHDNLTYSNTSSNILKNNKSNSTVHLIKGNSQQLNTFIECKNLIGEDIDCLFIDGDHSYEGCKKDFELYSQIVRKNGLVIFDDYNKHWPGVQKTVQEIITQTNKWKLIGTFCDSECVIQKLY